MNLSALSLMCGHQVTVQAFVGLATVQLQEMVERPQILTSRDTQQVHWREVFTEF